VVAIAEPLRFKRDIFGQKYVWGKDRAPKASEAFDGYEEFIQYELERRAKVKSKEIKLGDDEYFGVDAVFVCVLDELHAPVCKALAPLGLHIMCEKPLATTVDDCTSILDTVKREWEVLGSKTIFGIGHVLRYSPLNVMLRKLVREEKVIGDVVSLEHTEPIGWWHMTHSFVR
jgi:predicted dehydrogenase